MVSALAFLTAIKQGDVSVVGEYFAQPHVRPMVQELNDRFLTDPPMDALMLRSWYTYRQGNGINNDNDDDDDDDDSFHIFRLAIENDQLDVLAWFFAAERLAFMGATLAHMINHIARSAVAADDAGAIEILLSSLVFRDLLPTANRQALLQESLGGAVHRSRGDVITLLLSHGAQIDHCGQFDPLKLCAAYGGPRQLATLVENGAVVFGSPLLKIAVANRNITIAPPLLELGVDYTHALLMAAYQEEPEFTELFVDASFIDVDERFFDQETPLLVLLQRSQFTVCSKNRPQRMARVLIEFGTDVTAMNVRGKTALHIVAGSLWDGEIMELLLQFGADPNAKTVDGKTVLECIDLRFVDDRWRTETKQRLEILLKHGADPFMVGRCGRSIYDCLLDTVAGQEFVASHPEHFLKS